VIDFVIPYFVAGQRPESLITFKIMPRLFNLGAKSWYQKKIP